MIKAISRLLLMTIFVFYGLLLVVPTLEFHMFMIRNFSSKGSYIASIELGERTELANEVLMLFGEVGGGIVKKQGTRPITITDLSALELYFFPRLLGRAYPYHDKCAIKMNPLILDEDTFATTLLHEYLHCLGYLHVDKRGDLMYPYNNNITKESILNWADKVKKEIFYE